MKQILLTLLFSATLFCTFALDLKDASAIVNCNEVANPQNPIAYGDYDNDGKQDILYSTASNSSNSGFLVYSYAKKTTLLEVTVGKDEFVNDAYFMFEDFDGDGDKEVSYHGYIFDYATDGVVKN